METFATFRVDRERLVGVVHLPDTPRPTTGFPGVVMLHGLTGNRSEEGRLFTLASRAFAGFGLASLRFDFRGSGDSEGHHEEMTVSREVEDAFAALAYLRGLPEIDPERVSVLGYSLGGMVAALIAPHARPHRLALWSPMLPQDVLRYVPMAMLPPHLLEVKGLGVSRAFLTEMARLDPLEALRRAGPDAHVFHPEKDTTVDRGSAERYAEAAGAPLSIVPRVGHAFEKIAAREALYEGTGAFLTGRW